MSQLSPVCSVYKQSCYKTTGLPQWPPSNAQAYYRHKAEKTNKQKAYRHIASSWVAAVPFFACHGVAIISVVPRSSGLNKGRVLKGKN